MALPMRSTDQPADPRLTDSRYAVRADRLAKDLQGWSGEERIADLIERVAAEPELGIRGGSGS